jgi:leucyl/phenylalanyl-tRNA--protein transferase
MPVYQLTADLIFPPPRLAEPEGLLAVGGDLSPERLLLAYASGIFPWYSDGDPILWWSPDPRLVLYLDDLHISRSLARTIRKGIYTITMDTDFEAVITACAQTRDKNRDGTWITDDMIAAYITLHDLGYAHSIEVRHDDTIVGGLYGISLGRSFFGESMFSAMTDASKVALIHLTKYLRTHKFHFIDCQLPTDHLIRMGASQVHREKFLKQLAASMKYPSLTGPWT